MLFRQSRVGRNGAVFILRKFRSMRVDAEAETGPVWAQANDPRVTRRRRAGCARSASTRSPRPGTSCAGRCRSSVRGPERPEFIAALEAAIPFYAQRHLVRPGITGWAQVNLPYGATVDDARQKLGYDLYYVTPRQPSPRPDDHGAHALARRPPPALAGRCPRACRAGMLNALTVDVEEYFHPNAMDGVVAPARVGRAAARVEAQHATRCSICSASTTCGRRSSSSAGSPSARRSWSSEIARRGHEVACHGFAHRLVYRLGPRAVPRRRIARPGAARRPGRPAGHRLPRRQLLDRRRHAVGARRPDRARLRLRLEHLPDPPRSLRHPDLQPRAGARAAPGGRDPRDPAVDDPAARTQLAGRRRRLPAPAAVLGDAPGACAGSTSTSGVPGMVYVHPWELDLEQPRLAGRLRWRACASTRTCTAPSRGCASCCASFASRRSATRSRSRRRRVTCAARAMTGGRSGPAAAAVVVSPMPAMPRRGMRFVRRTAGGTFFHLIGWKEVLERTFGFTAHYLVARRGSEIVGVLPLFELHAPCMARGLLSLPFAVEGGVCSADAAAQAALDAARAGARRGARCALGRAARRARRGPASSLREGRYWPLPARAARRRRRRSRRHCRAKRRNMIRRGSRHGLQARVDAADLPAFHDLYARTARRFGTPVFPLRFFRALLERFPDETALMTVRLRRHPRRRRADLLLRRTVCPYYVGSRREFFRYAVNDFLYWELMRYARRARRAGVRLRPQQDAARVRSRSSACGASSPSRCATACATLGADAGAATLERRCGLRMAAQRLAASAAAGHQAARPVPRRPLRPLFHVGPAPPTAPYAPRSPTSRAARNAARASGESHAP